MKTTMISGGRGIWLVAGALALFTGLSGVQGAPFKPSDDARVLERLPEPAGATRAGLRRLREALAAEPRNVELAVDLARRYIQLAQAELDPRYASYAQAALAPWYEQPAPPLEVLVLRATLRQHRHAFDEALADFAQVLRRDPGNVQALLSRAVILQVQGRYEAAYKSCAPLLLTGYRLIASVCANSAAALNGRARSSLESLNKALQDAPDAEPHVRQWVLTILAETAERLGRTARAEAYFTEALAMDRRDVYLLAAYADFLLEQDRAGEVRDLLAGEEQADVLLLRLALAEQRLGASGFERHARMLRERFEASRRRGDTRHRRETARFTLHVLDQPDRALRLARENWAVQREPRDARLLLEAALAADAGEAAEPVLVWLRNTGLEDVRIEALADRLREVDSS